LLQGTILALKKATPDIAEPGLQGRKQTPEDTLSVRYTHTTGTSLVSHWTHKRILQAGPKPETRSLDIDNMMMNSESKRHQTVSTK
jgi:hypothetical protein